MFRNISIKAGDAMFAIKPFESLTIFPPTVVSLITTWSDTWQPCGQNINTMKLKKNSYLNFWMKIFYLDWSSMEIR